MASQTGGVKAFSIQGRLYRERERMIGMTEEERCWRQQWIKDQVLAPEEPKFVRNFYKERFNPIRRAYCLPLNCLFKALEPVLGKNLATYSRVITGKLCMTIACVYAAAYYFKYNTNDWTRKGGWRVITSRTSCVPGDPGFPMSSGHKVGSDYASRGFKNSPI